jgi:Photoprotection regulator fluorescence recovery protein
MGDAMVEGWSDSEQTVARQAFDTAYGRAIAQLVDAVQSKAVGLTSAQSVWELHDYLSIERHTIEGRFDFRLDGILFVFASLVKDNLLELAELQGLAADKLAKISAMSRF